MDTAFTQNLLLLTGGAFLLGWFVAKVGGYLGRKFTAPSRDPRDDRIRSLLADVRVAQTVAAKARTECSEQAAKLAEAEKNAGLRNEAFEKQEKVIRQLRGDLRESVRKTRELREELTDRATENLKSTVRLREMETELSVARASTDLLTSGLLDYPGQQQRTPKTASRARRKS